ncbi:MAG: trypsin-like peptidase domain-containing protein [Deltaproteobacteria bacterium]|nr:trypsin-like peptidase domain-containing protein [Deltaproteobacteria bacterium]
MVQLFILMFLILMFSLPLRAGVTQILPQQGAVGPKAIETLTKEALAEARPATVNIKALKSMGNGSFVQSIGSGVLISEAGYILTNEHVVGGSQNIEVTLWRVQNKNYRGRVVGSDKKLDLALIRIKPHAGETFPVARVALSNAGAQVKTGDRVVAIGNPFGLSHTVTSGIVSATGRTLEVGGLVYEGLIQTDAPINQGNSGGPLVNLRGEVVGINSAILAEDPFRGGFAGQGFAIPMDVAINFSTERMRVK